MRFTPTHLIVLIIVVLLLFAAPKLPALARNLGQSMRIFSSEVKQMKEENTTKKAEGAATTDAPSQGAGSTAAEPVEGRVVDRDVRDDR